MLGDGDIITLGAGNYRLGTRLAASSYGVVWQARGPQGAEVALKLINEEQMGRADPALQERWISSAATEIDFLCSLAPWDERHIVPLLDHGVHQGLPVMALELMGPDLARAPNAAGSFQHMLEWVGQINQALAAVHRHGWLYLDLKPANVLVGRSGSDVKLADFGTSRLRAALAPGVYCGTASWQAPEQFFPTAQHTFQTDTRSDYFALGAMLYFLVTGGRQLRFCSSCGEAWRVHLAQAPARLLAEHGGQIPPTLQEDEAQLFAHAAGSAAAPAALTLLRALLAQAPAARPRHALDISRMLAAIGSAACPVASSGDGAAEPHFWLRSAA
ncbi:protein kinase [Massilia sp. CF038]|uniref:protein kinase domain-containing protein n=1 Tax=Massilia sp. CF038 TaxID=1881045 RepID=UPI00091A6A3E|nr:protein kinase [Massilia sp. CF038]SHG98800.1 serine/threonine protein kinase [Massilia sp. CF038]